MNLLDKLLGRKKQLPAFDLSNIGIDIHSHLLPGIDDGSKSMSESISLIKKMMELGYSKAITTPHVMVDYYPNSSKTIREKRDELKREIEKEGLDFELEAAAEYFFDEHFNDLISKSELLTFGDNYVLFELPMFVEPVGINETLFELQIKGYKPVLAHPERYTYWYNDFDKYKALVDKDVLLQLNINSLSGVYSPQAKEVAEKLIDENLISFIGSDCHNRTHLEVLENSTKQPYFHKIADSDRLLNKTL